MYPCPCCGYRVYEAPPGSYDICPICFWEDDIVQIAFPDGGGGANALSLIQSQQNYDSFGASEERFKCHVRVSTVSDIRDEGWRRLNELSDNYLQWSKPDDHQRWAAVKDREVICLYYWAADYWLSR